MNVSILDFGAAVSNGAVENGRAIQHAIDAAHTAGGGVVEVPAGIFQTSNVILRSNVTLYLAPGSVLSGSRDFRHYTQTAVPMPTVNMCGCPPKSPDACWCGLVQAEGAKNIAICGSGTLEGNGQGHAYFPHPDDPYSRRPTLFFFDRCTNVRLEGVTLRNPAKFSVLGNRSDTIWMENVRVFSWDTENGDGLDVDGCSNVVIRSCILEAGDDCISLKCTDPAWPCRNIVISQCILRSVWAGFRMGTESSADMKDILLSDCVFERCNDALKIQVCSTGVYENVRIQNVSMRDVHRPLFMTINSFQLAKKDTSIRPRLGGLRNVEIDGMTAYMSKDSGEYQRNCFVISGDPKCAVEGVNLRNMRVVFDGPMEPGSYERVDVPEYLDYSMLYADIFSINGGYPAAGLFLRHIRGLTMENCRLIREDGDPRPMIFGYDLQDVTLRRIRAAGSPVFFQAEESGIRLEDCTLEDAAACVTAIPEPLQQRFRDFRRISAETDALLETLAAAVDQARACPVRQTVADWEKTPEIWTTELTLTGRIRWLYLVTYGHVIVTVNGEEAGRCCLPELYDNQCAWAVDLRRFGPGNAVVALHWLEPEREGGIVCKLPFGAFRALRPGLRGDAELFSI